MIVPHSHRVSGCPHFDGVSHAVYETGNAADAREWIHAADLPDAERDAYLSFVAGFPGLTFTRELESTLHMCECRNRLTLPGWYHTAKTTLSFVHSPGRRARALFDGYDFDCYCADRERETWREIDVDAMPEDDEDEYEMLVEKAGAYLFGGEYDTDRSDLAINLADPEDRRIHGFAIENLWDHQLDDETIRTVPEPLFASYAGMLSHIAALKLGNDIVRRVGTRPPPPFTAGA